MFCRYNGEKREQSYCLIVYELATIEEVISSELSPKRLVLSSGGLRAEVAEEKGRRA
jgi:hypothetical protein